MLANALLTVFVAAFAMAAIKDLLTMTIPIATILTVLIVFSLMSKFNIGFRELNFWRWIRMIQPREFDIKARGWPRCVSGLQSLLSVGLVALSLLSYFGRPFEN